MRAIEPFTRPWDSTNSSVSWLSTSTSAFPSPTTSSPLGSGAASLTLPAPAAYGGRHLAPAPPLRVAVASDGSYPRSPLAGIPGSLGARSHRQPGADRHRDDVGLEVRLGRWPQAAPDSLDPAVERGALRERAADRVDDRVESCFVQ